MPIDPATGWATRCTAVSNTDRLRLDVERGAPVKMDAAPAGGWNYAAGASLVGASSLAGSCTRIGSFTSPSAAKLFTRSMMALVSV